MNETEREPLRQRWREIEQQLGELYEGKVQDGDPAEREGVLLAEQDEIEFVLGAEWLARRQPLDGDADNEGNNRGSC